MFRNHSLLMSVSPAVNSYLFMSVVRRSRAANGGVVNFNGRVENYFPPVDERAVPFSIARISRKLNCQN